MNLVYYESQSSQKPDLIDTTSSKKVVYLRKDITTTEVPVDDSENAETTTMYTYKEAKLTKEEYETYKLELQMDNTIDLERCTLDELKSYWKEKINEQCTEVIAAGVDVETTQGTEHFSLTFADQINIAGIMITLDSGDIAGHPYHADGKTCRFFSKEELVKISAAATQYKVYNTTVCNHIHTWINRCESKEEVEAISFTSTLPDDLAQSLQAIVASTQTTTNN